MKNHAKIIHVQGVLYWEEVEKLLQRTKKDSIKEAISEAVRHYLECIKEEPKVL